MAIDAGAGLAAAFGGGDLLGGLGATLGSIGADIGGLFGIGGADAAAGALGAGAADVAGGASLADIVGTGAVLQGGGAAGLDAGLALGGSTAADLVPAAVGGSWLDTVIGSGAAGSGLDALLGGGGTSLLGAAGAGAAFPTAAGGVATSVAPTATGAFGSAAGATPTTFGAGVQSVPYLSVTPSVAAGGGAAGAAGPAGLSVAPDAASTAAAGLGGVASTPAAGVAGAAGAATPTTSIASLLENAGSSVLKSLGTNPLGIAAGVGGLGYDILQGRKQTANEKALQADAASATNSANSLAGQGAALQQYLTNGTLPAAYEQQVDQAIAAAKQTAISNAASQGLPTNPAQNTALAATLAQIDGSRATLQTQIAQQLFQSGTSLLNAGQSAAGLSSSLYNTLVQNDTAASANTGKAIATLAAALNTGGNKGLTLNLGGSP